ncbi:MAG: Rrf2 family transcriptional regulator [Planctomycetota bacterium]
MPKPKPRTKLSPARGGPMQMTASSGYAIHGLAYLAYKGGDTVTYLSEIAEFFSIPSSYLAKVFQALARGGLVASYRGAKGGYALSRPGNEITLRQVIEIFEGPIRNDCPLMRSPCNVRTLCSVSTRIGRAQQAFLDELDRHSIEEIGNDFIKMEEQGVQLDQVIRELRG